MCYGLLIFGLKLFKQVWFLLFTIINWTKEKTNKQIGLKKIKPKKKFKQQHMNMAQVFSTQV